MKKRSAVLALLTTGLLAWTAAAGPLGAVALPAAQQPAHSHGDVTQITAGYLSIGLDRTGEVTSLVNLQEGTNYLAAGKHAPLVSLVIDGRQEEPTRMTRSGDTLHFSSSTARYTVDVKVRDSATYSTLEVTGVTAPAREDVQTLLWGPLPTSISQTLGETVGVAHNDNFAIGLRPLTDRTEGGWPQQYQQYGWEKDVDRNPASLQVATLEEWSVGGKVPWGTVLRAFTFDYTKERMRQTTAGYQIPVGPLPGKEGKVVGSKVAIFGAIPSMTTTVLSNIAHDQRLPYPTIDGQWQKTAQAASQSFLVLSDLKSSNVQQASAFGTAAGIDYLYSLRGANGPWQSAGHNQFDDSLGGSDAGAANAVATAESHGENLGAHTLSDFIDTNDGYVQPAPADGRLALGGRSALARPLTATDDVLYLRDDRLLSDGPYGKKLRIGDEFIDYTGYQKVGDDIEVSGLKRAQWGSAAATHASGAVAARVLMNSYNGALGGLGIIDEIATRFATIWNDTGIKATSFDGLESASESGWGSYGISRLVNGAYRQTKDHDGFLSETSRMTSNTWDALSRASWGEVGKTSMNQVFLNNAYYEDNDLPGMLGWISLSGNESLLSVESKLARGAGLNAGAGFETSVSSLQNGGANTTAVLDAIKQWEAARNIGAFSDAQKAAFRDQSTNWHLTAVQPGRSWSLQQLDADGNVIGTPEPVKAPVPAIATRSLSTAVSGELYEQAVTSNTPATVRYTVSAGSLPRGLTLNADTGGISGVPQRPGTSRFTITAHNSKGLADARAGYTMNVRAFGPHVAQTMKAPLDPASDPVTVTVANNGTHALSNVHVAVTADDGWTVRPPRSQPNRITPGTASTAAFTLVPPDQSQAGVRTLHLTATTRYDYPGSKGWSSTTTATVTLPLDSLAQAFNNVAITDDASPAAGDFDGSGDSYSAQALAAEGLTPGGTFTHGGLTFRWPAPVGSPNNLTGAATFRVPGDGATLGLLGSAVGPQTGTGTITYTDGTTQAFDVDFDNWAGDVAGDAVVASHYRNTPAGPANHGYNYRVFLQSVALQPGKTLFTITTPSNDDIHIFSAAIG